MSKDVFWIFEEDFNFDEKKKFIFKNVTDIDLIFNLIYDIQNFDFYITGESEHDLKLKIDDKEYFGIFEFDIEKLKDINEEEVFDLFHDEQIINFTI